MKHRRTTLSPWMLSLLALGLATSGIAQPPEDQSPTAPDGPELAAILQKVGQDDLEGAIADLEILREAGKASAQALATLGALYLEIGLPRDAFEILDILAQAEDANPAVLYNAGRAALEANQDENKAESYLQRSVATHPISPAARLLGLRRGAEGNTVEAYRLLGPWALANPEDHEARMAAAVAALKLERLPAAQEMLQGLDATQPRVRLLRADLALKQRDPATAADLLEPLAAAPPAEMETDVFVLLSTAWLELGRSADVLKLLAGKVSQRPRLALVLAKAQNQGGDPSAAIATLDPFIQPILLRNPNDMPPGPARILSSSITREQGRFLLAVDQADEAIPLLERSAIFEPHARETWQELARALAATGETAKAEAALERFSELAEAKKQAEVPGLKGRRRVDDTTGRRLAEALEWSARGDEEKALDMVRQEISLTPRDPRPRLLEIRTLLSLGRTVEARQAAERTVEAFPELPDARHFRAVALLSEGDLEAAEADLREVLRMAENHLPAQNDLALVLARRGDLAGARGILEEILAAHPDDSLARQRLAALQASENGGGD